MKLENKPYWLKINKEQIMKYCSLFYSNFKKSIKNNVVYTRYIDLGVKIVRLQITDKDFLPIVERIFSCSLTDSSNNYDATIYLWKDNIKSYVPDDFNSAEFLSFYYENNRDLIKMFFNDNVLTAKDVENNNYYFAMNEISLNTILKIGYLFVHFISSITTTSTSTLVHAASVGINNKGVLFCGKCGSGKSTLSVSCLMKNFQYVADGYLILNKKENNLYAYPIYSMITLTPQIVEKMPNLETTYMGFNYAYDQKKEFFNISNYKNVVKKLKINAAIFPNIANVQEPTIEKTKKGKAITQLIYPTAIQMGQNQNTGYMKLLISLVKDLNFYQINLSYNLEKNVKILRQFIKEL